MRSKRRLNRLERAASDLGSGRGYPLPPTHPDYEETPVDPTEYKAFHLGFLLVARSPDDEFRFGHLRRADPEVRECTLRQLEQDHPDLARRLRGRLEDEGAPEA